MRGHRFEDIKKYPISTLSGFIISGVKRKKVERVNKFLDMRAAIALKTEEDFRNYLKLIGDDSESVSKNKTSSKSIDADEISKNIRRFKREFAIINQGV